MNTSNAAYLALMGFGFGTVFTATYCAMYFISGTLLAAKRDQTKATRAALTAARLVIAVGLLFVMALAKQAKQLDPSNILITTAFISSFIGLLGLRIVRDVFSVRITHDDLSNESHGKL